MWWLWPILGIGEHHEISSMLVLFRLLQGAWAGVYSDLLPDFGSSVSPSTWISLGRRNWNVFSGPRRISPGG